MLMETSNSTEEILLVEDSPTDALLTREAFEDSKIISKVNHVFDGEQAMAFLRQEDGFATKQRPGLILLDLNLPKKSGFEVLAEIKGSKKFSHIPVIVLTTSMAEEDIIKSYDLRANCYITKLVEFDRFVEVARAIHEFWINMVRLPPKTYST